MSNLRGEERLVTVVFADLTESVRRTADLTPEEATSLVSPLLEAMVELMIRHGGRIDRFLGDGVLAVFGVPIANEDDPIRAVRAAMELRERATSLGLAVTVGINTGRVYFGPVGSDLHEELTVMGPTVNLAARLQSAAAADQILVGETTRAHVRRAFELEPVRLEVKGIAEPVTAYLAEYEADHPDKVRGIEGLRAELVGRDRELHALHDLLDGAHHTVALIGQAGVGKSRLASELCRVAAGEGYSWMEGRCLESTRHLAYGPWIDLLRRRFGGTSAPAGVREEIGRLTDAGLLMEEQAAEMIPFLAGLLGEDDHRASDQMDGDRRRRLTVSALVDFIGAGARLSPLVVFIEDLHWADDASVEVVDQLHLSAHDHPLVAVLAARPDPDSPAHGLMDRLEPAGTELPLRELTTDETRILLDRLLQRSGLPDDLAERIANHAGGNPFYVEEIVRTFIQHGVLVRSDSTWQVTADIDSIPLPESVEGLLMSRFDRLPPPIKQAARAASVIGEGLTEDLLDAVAGPGTGLHLPALASAGIVSGRGHGPEAEYGFVHALTRQAIYSSLLPSHRTELHGRVAAVLEGRQPIDVGRLAFHYDLAADDGKAVQYLVAAAEEAMAAYTNQAARHHLDRALERASRLDPAEQRHWRGRILLDIGEILERDAQHEAARATLAEALDLLDSDPLEQARAWLLTGRTHRLEESFDEAHACYTRAEDALDRMQHRDSPEAHRAWIEIQQERSFALYFGGRGKELPAHNARMAPVVEAHGSTTQLVDLRRAMLLDRFSNKRWNLDADDVEFARRTLELARAGTDPQQTAENLFSLGFTLLWADEVEEAAAVLEEATAGCRRVGDVVHHNRAGSYLAVALRRAGRMEAARAAALASLELSTSVGSEYYRGHALATLCWVAWRTGDPAHEQLGRQAYQAWGRHSTPGFEGLETEFAWMAVWPLAAGAHSHGATEEAVAHLQHLLVPWERPMPPDLAGAVKVAVETRTDEPIAGCIEAARQHMLL